MPQASLLVTIGIAALAVVVPALVLAGVYAASPSASRATATRALAAAMVLLLGGTFALARAGFYADVEARPPRMLFVLAPVLLLPLALGLSSIGARLAARLPLAALVGFHAFRLPLELVMHQAALEGTMPVQMSYSGWNFDIVTGGLAAVVAVLAARGAAPRWLVVAFSTIGTALLVTIVTIAVLSLPAVRAFGSEPERVNTWVAHAPFVWLPSSLVSCAILGHVVLWRRLLRGTVTLLETAALPPHAASGAGG